MVVRGTSVLRFSAPLLYVEDNPTAFQAMFVRFATRLKAIHGYAGHGLVLSAVRLSDNQPFEAYLSEKPAGLDVGNPVAGATNAHEGIKTVSWLTAINHALVQKVGGAICHPFRTAHGLVRTLRLRRGVDHPGWTNARSGTDRPAQARPAGAIQHAAQRGSHAQGRLAPRIHKRRTAHRRLGSRTMAQAL
jgi:hypothetical protein